MYLYNIVFILILEFYQLFQSKLRKRIEILPLSFVSNFIFYIILNFINYIIMFYIDIDI